MRREASLQLSLEKGECRFGMMKKGECNSPLRFSSCYLILSSCYPIVPTFAAIGTTPYFFMKKILLSLFAACALLQARADEGMWLPQLIGKNYEEMKRLGLKLSPEDIFSINQASLKDAIVQFGGGCTAEMVSASGLLMTNHHCGYDAIASLSSVEKNYLDNGFWAKSFAEELPAQGLSVIYLQEVVDVTPEVMAAVRNTDAGPEWNRKYDAIRKKLEARASQGGKLVANVKEYFNGNQYLLLTYKKYNDVRLVGTPPKSVGKFGGDTDNWMWPRHTADFSMFRVYADANNEPADYSPSNVPYKPKKFLPISAKGVQENDFAMVMGYPGRTDRYLTSYGVSLATDVTSPAIVKIRGERLATMKKYMDADKSVYLKLTSNYQRVSNYWKYFIGQSEQLKRLNIESQKRKEEQQFTRWASTSKVKANRKYSSLMSDFAGAYADYRPVAKTAVYYSEAFRAPVLSRLASASYPLYTYLEKGGKNADSVKKYTDGLRAARKSLMKEYVPALDKEMFSKMTLLYYKDVPSDQHPDVYQRVIFKQFGSDDWAATMNRYADFVIQNTQLLDDSKFDALANAPTAEALRNDPAMDYAYSFIRSYDKYVKPRAEDFAADRKDLSMFYTRAAMKMQPERNFYPDANSTMRLSYGSVLSYEPQDAVFYRYYTTSEGLLDKYKPGDGEFDLPVELVELLRKKDFGRWANDKGELVVNFITNNDITGGNSGSPIINGNGEWIGTAFDGNWEAMSGDIAFDKKYKRTIAADARFIMFIIDKLGNAQNLIEEMDIRH